MCGPLAEARSASHPKGKQVVNVASSALPGILLVGSLLRDSSSVDEEENH